MQAYDWAKNVLSLQGADEGLKDQGQNDFRNIRYFMKWEVTNAWWLSILDLPKGQSL